MKRPGGFVVVAIASALAGGPAAALAPPPGDPIADLLSQRAVDPEEPDTAAAGNSRVDPDAESRSDPAPRQRPRLDQPVFLHETGKTPDAPPSAADEAYDSRLRASAASARGFRGPMDGGWTLSAGARPLYALELNDVDGVVEGAWRDLRRPGALDASGYIDAIERNGADVILRLSDGAVARLHPVGDRFAGEVTAGGRTEAATLARPAR